MSTVTRNNFQTTYLEIETLIKTAKFIAIDCEFSGLTTKNSSQLSLFDTNDERYRKLRSNVTDFVPIQIGLSLFQYERDKNKYAVNTYTFFTVPKALGAMDHRFSFQASSIQFLCHYNFDFNKLFSDGIPYLTKSQEHTLRKKCETDIIQNFIEAEMESIDMSLIDNEVDSISQWFQQAQPEQIYTVSNVYSDAINYSLRKELSVKFPKQIVSFFEDNHLKIKKTYNDLIEENFEKDLIDSAIGFTKVFRLLSQSKKPIVGHNLFLDLLFLFHYCEEDLPTRYGSFKQKTNALFPVIYDTKFISYEILQKLPKDSRWRSNGLEDLYSFFLTAKGWQIASNSPQIEQRNPTVHANHFHNAGFDSFCTGYCFVRMIHYLASERHEHSFDRLITSLEHMKAAERFRNCVNIIRGNLTHFRIDGPDPVSQRPPWLHVVTNGNKLDAFELVKIFGKFGSVDVKMLTKKTALVAVATKRSAQEILEAFKSHKKFTVTTYSALWHSPRMKICLLTGILLLTGVFSSICPFTKPFKLFK